MKKSRINFVLDAVTLVLMLAMVCTGVVIRYTLPPGSGGHGGGRGLHLWGMDRHEWGGLHFWLAVVLCVLVVLHVVLHWSWVVGVLRGLFHTKKTAKGGTGYGLGFLAAVVLLIGGFYGLAAGNVETVWGPGGSRPVTTVSTEPAAHTEPAHTEPAHIDPGRGQGKGLGRGQGRGLGRGQGRGLGRGLGRGQGRGLGRGPEQRQGETIRGHMTLKEVASLSGVPADRLKSLLGLPASASIDERLGRLRRVHGFQMADLRRVIATAQKR